MKAETAYQVIQALPESEVIRLYSILGIKPAVIKKIRKTEKKPLISDAEAIEYLLMKFRGG